MKTEIDFISNDKHRAQQLKLLSISDLVALQTALPSGMRRDIIINELEIRVNNIYNKT